MSGCLILVLVAGCGSDDPTDPAVALPEAVLVVSGQAQVGVVGESLAEPLVVRVVDGEGNPIRGQIVNFHVTSGGGGVFGGTAVTNADGLAQEIWTLGPVAGSTQTLEARAVNPATGAPIVFATFTATAGPGAVFELVPAAHPSSAIAGSTLALQVTVLDRFGNAVPSTEVVWTVVAGGGSATPNIDTTDTGGRSDVVWRLGGGADAQIVRAAHDTVGAVFSVQAVPSSAATVSIAPEVATMRVGETSDFAAEARDEYGNVIQDPALTWSTGDSAIAVVSADGTVTGIGPGDVMIVVDAGTAADTARVTIELVTRTYTAVTPGDMFTCALDADGRGVCWGSNDAGSLGNGTRQSSPYPVAVDGGHTFTRIDAGTSGGSGHVCALTAEAGPNAYCWGGGGAALGNGSISSQTTPTPVAGGIEFRSISAGYVVTCGISASREAYCWGDNQFYALGIGPEGTTDEYATPQAVVDGAFDTLSVGGYWTQVCALRESGRAYCWGSDTYGALGNTGGTRNVPDSVATDSVFRTIAAGQQVSCGTTAAGTTMCWGYSDVNGDGSPAGIWTGSTPRVVADAPPFTQITAGNSYACGLTAEGEAFCWGENVYGQLGTGDTIGSATPRPVATTLRFREIEAGGFGHTCAITTSNIVYCWGRNTYGQIGAPTTDECRTSINSAPMACALTPTKVAGQP